MPTPADAPANAGRSVPRTSRSCLSASPRLFDLDGVLTQTAKVHAAAWKEMFDAYLRERSEQTGEPFRPFKIASDYVKYA